MTIRRFIHSRISGSALALMFLFTCDPAWAATFSVTNTNASGGGSLRQAILDANANSGSDTITFNIPGGGPHVIQPTAALPAITGPTTVDGSSQPGFSGVPLIVVDGSAAGGSINGLRFTGGNSTLRSVVVNNWSANGVQLVSSGSNTIAGCYVGTNPTGTSAQPNGVNGIIVSNITNNVIGGTTVADRNVIAGNNASGLRITGAGSSGNRVEGNFFGINAAGTAVLPNGFPGGGSNILMDGAPNNTIGGATTSHRNIISGASMGHGLSISGAGAVNNRVENNFVGTNPAGTASLPNISGGVVVSNSATGTIIEDNLISGNLPSGGGIKIEFSATATKVLGNLIGTDVNGTSAIPNFRGVLIQTASGNTVGGPNPGDANVIAGNQSNGVAIQNAGSTNNLIEGNLIGTDITGTAPMGNGNNGVQIGDVPGNTVRGNVIADSTFNGIQILSAGATGNQILDNFIGTNAAGTGALGNHTNGIVLANAPNNVIGLAGLGNLISGNGPAGAGNGIRLDGAGSTGNAIQGNFIGTRSDGTSPLGNGSRGIFLTSGPSDNTIGGQAAGEGNTIAFNDKDGVGIESGTGNTVSGNSIHDNGTLGIELWPIGVSPNDSGDGDSGANGQQNYPVLSNAVVDGATTIVDGTLNSNPSSNFQLEFFSVVDCDASGMGEGAVFLGSIFTTTNGTGNASFMAALGATTPLHWIASTATDQLGNTSELSDCQQIQSGSCSNCIFLDGFESGTTAEWPTSVGE